MGWENNSVFQVLIITGSTGSGVFVYNPSPGAGNLVASIAAAAGTDPYGNAYQAGITSYAPGNPIAQLLAGSLQLGSPGLGTSTKAVISTTVSPGQLLATSGLNSAGDVAASWTLTSQAFTNGPGMIVNPGNPNPPKLTPALLEAQAGAGQIALELIPTAAGNAVLGTQVSGDTVDRLAIDGNGQHSWSAGTGVSDAQLHRLAANSMSFKTCDLSVESLSRGFRAREGANCKQGTATLAAGTILVANTSITAVSRVFLTPQDNNATGALRVSARVAGTSFTITSSNAADTGVVAYEIFEPA